MANDRDRPILVVDDDAKIVRLVRMYLERERYRVVEAFDGAAALAAIEAHDPALVVLDLMIPEIDGLAVVRAVRGPRRTRRSSSCRLAARPSIGSTGSSLGADDYLPKPFSPAELVLRVRRVLARSGAGDRRTRQPLMTHGGLVVDRARHTVSGRWAACPAHGGRAPPPRHAPRSRRPGPQPRPAPRRGVRPRGGGGARSDDRRPHRPAPRQARRPAGRAAIHRDRPRRRLSDRSTPGRIVSGRLSPACRSPTPRVAHDATGLDTWGRVPDRRRGDRHHRCRGRDRGPRRSPGGRGYVHPAHGASTAAAPRRRTRCSTSRCTVVLAIAVLAAAGAAVAVATVLGSRLARPLGEIGRAARRIAAGDYLARVPREGPDEIASLADSFNQMATSLEEGERLRREFIANAAHELRTPLTNLKGYLEGLRDGVIAADEATFMSLSEEVERLVRLAASLDTLAAGDARRLTGAARRTRSRRRRSGPPSSSPAQGSSGPASPSASSSPIGFRSGPTRTSSPRSSATSSRTPRATRRRAVRSHPRRATSGRRGRERRQHGAGHPRPTCRTSSSASTASTSRAIGPTVAPGSGWPSSSSWSKPTAAASGSSPVRSHQVLVQLAGLTASSGSSSSVGCRSTRPPRPRGARSSGLSPRIGHPRTTDRGLDPTLPPLRREPRPPRCRGRR